ncbi:MAG TPA: hypothetical protein VF549_18225 [Solirubrobacteraceae bacterium]|jgi:hypothetical protein
MIPELGVLRKPSISPAFLVLPAVLAGIAGTVVAVAGREPGDTFVLRQKRLQPVKAAELEAAVKQAPNALPGSGGGRGVSARCTSRGEGTLGNPWRCVVVYPSGDRIRYRVTVTPDRRFHGTAPALDIRGCCAGEPG